MSFATLPEEAQARRLAGLARAALGAWGLEGAAVSLLKYRENAVFRVDAADGRRFALRVHRPAYRSDAAIRSEVAWMRALAADGVPTPEVLPTRGGDVLVHAEAPGVPEPRQCDLLAWVEGAPLGSLEQGVDLDEAALRACYRTVGEIAGRIHAHGAAWTPPEGFERPAWDVASLVGDAPAFGRFQDLPEIPEDALRVLFAARDRVRERLAALPPPAALVHGDLIPDNLLATGRRVRVIDFDDCGWSWVGFELITSVFPLLLGGGFDAATEAWLEGYRTVRPFPEGEREATDTFVVARALSYLGWPAGRPEIATQRRLVPFLVPRITELAGRYLAANGSAAPHRPASL
jgi:Ser/Thr protein kinase RdoA (MazF antagonist)